MLTHPATANASNRNGLSLVELSVVITIIAVVAAIAMPAVQSSRESARRISCQNNLRQVLLATHASHDANGHLPSLYNGTSLSYPLKEWDLFHMHSWRVPLLLHLEKSALHEQIDFRVLATASVNEQVSQSVVPAFICPSGSNPASDMGWGLHHQNFDESFDEGNTPEYAKYYVVRSDYDAMAGAMTTPNPKPETLDANSTSLVRWGVWGWPRFETPTVSGTRLLRYQEGKFSHISDGLSNTIAVVERGGKPIQMKDGKPDVTTDNPNAAYPGQAGWSASNSFAWNLNAAEVGVNESNSGGIYSLHPAGANVAMADGSVRFLSDSTDNKTIVRMFSRSGGP